MTQTVDLESPAHKGSPQVLNIKNLPSSLQHTPTSHAIYKIDMVDSRSNLLHKINNHSKKRFHSQTLLGAWITSRKRPTGFLLLISIGLHSGQCHQAYKGSQIFDTSETE